MDRSVSCGNSTESYRINSPQANETLQPHDLSRFKCYLKNSSRMVPEFTEEEEVMNILQKIQGVPMASCDVPAFRSYYDKFQYLQCLLKLFAEWLKK